MTTLPDVGALLTRPAPAERPATTRPEPRVRWVLNLYFEPDTATPVAYYGLKAEALRAARTFARDAEAIGYMVSGNADEGYSLQRRYGEPPRLLYVERA